MQAFLFISTAVINFNSKIFFNARIFNPMLGPNSIKLLILKRLENIFLKKKKIIFYNFFIFISINITISKITRPKFFLLIY